MPPSLSSDLVEKVRTAVNPNRLVETAIALVEVPSPTRSAGPAADRLAEILTSEGFAKLSAPGSNGFVGYGDATLSTEIPSVNCRHPSSSLFFRCSAVT